MGKKLSVLSFAIILMFALAACDGDIDDGGSSAPSGSSTGSGESSADDDTSSAAESSTDGDTSSAEPESSTGGDTSSATASSAAASSATASSAAVSSTAASSAAASSAAASSAAASSRASSTPSGASSAAVSSTAPISPPTNIVGDAPDFAFVGADFETVTSAEVAGVQISRAVYDMGNSFFGNSSLLIKGRSGLGGTTNVYMSPVMNQVGGSKDKISFWVKGTAAGSNIFFNTDSSNTGSFGATGTTAAYSIIKLNNGPYTWISSFDPEATNTGSFPNWTKITLDCAGKNFLTDLQKADGRTVCFKIRIGPGRDINLYIDNVIYEGSVPPVSSSAAASSAAASSAAVSSASLSRSSLEPSTDSVDSPEFAFNGADFEAAAAATSSSGVTVSRVIYAEESAFFGNRCLLVQGTASAGVTPYISPAMYRPSAGRNMISFWVKGTATAAYIFFAGTASNDNSPTFGSGSGTVTYATIPLDGTHTWRQNFTAMETGTYTDWTKVTFDCTGKNFFTSLQGSGTFCYKIRVSDGGTINLYIDNVIYETSPEGGSSAGASSAAASSSSAIPLQNAAVPLFTNAGFTLPGGSNYDNDVPKDETTGNNYGSSKAVYADSEDSILGSCMRLTYTSSGTARLVYQSPVGAFNTQSGYSRITFYIKGTLTGDFRIFLTSNNNIGSNNKVFDIINDSATTLSAAEPSGYTYGSATFGTWTKITLNYTASNHSLTTGATKALQIRVGGSSVNCDLFVDEFGWEN